MTMDLTLLRSMTSRDNCRRFYAALPKKALDEDLLSVLTGFQAYFESFKDHNKIDFATFIPWFERKYLATADDGTKTVFKAMIRNAQQPVSDDTQAVLFDQLMQTTLASALTQAIDVYNKGGEVCLPSVISAELEAYRVRTKAAAGAWNQTSIDEILADAENDDIGLTWRLPVLNKHMSRLLPGHYGIVAARPDAGKTSFLASEGTYLASQLPPEKNLIWLNNEGTSRAIIPRLYCAALRKTITEIGEMKRDALREAYVEAVGRIDRIRVYDVHGMTVHQVGRILEDSNPGLVFFDMLAHIHGFDSASRQDMVLERLHQWAREQCVRLEFVGISTSQISAEGEGELFPRLSMLKDSKTAVQGANDFVLAIGQSHEAGLENVRGVGLPKNKLARPGQKKSPNAEVAFVADRARYEPIQVLED